MTSGPRLNASGMASSDEEEPEEGERGRRDVSSADSDVGWIGRRSCAPRVDSRHRRTSIHRPCPTTIDGRSTMGRSRRPERSRIPHGPQQGHRHRRRQRRRDDRPADRRGRPRRRRPGRHRRGAARRARRSTSPRRRPVVGHDARITGTNDYADTAGLGHRGRHLRPRPPARDEPRRPAGQERRHRPRGRGAGRAALARTRS